MDEPVPHRLKRAAQRRRWPLLQAAASILIATAGGVAGWGLHGQMAASEPNYAAAPTAEEHAPRLPALARYAAMAYTVYAADQGRPVEITAAHEGQLVTWLSKRMGAPMKPPKLQALGYHLEGGRLLPGRSGPVAQFMYADRAGMRITLYVTHDGAAAHRPNAKSETGTTAFQFVQDGAVNVFYWIDGPFGYAISSHAGRAEIARVSTAVFHQLDPGGESNGASQPSAR